jgi:serine/threonine-protein kinase
MAPGLKSKGMTNADEFGLFRELFSKPEQSASLHQSDELDVSPQLIPGYEILAPLGKGGMGAVYRARQLSLDRVVALKLLNAEHSGDPEYVKRFLIEARTAGKLRHLNIVSALDCGSVKETRFMVMEFVEGKTLDATLKELGILNERVALQVIKQIAEGLEYAWQHGIIHRDIKPQNIMMTPDGTAKICDLGICKSVRRDLRLTSTGYVNCTPTHASPEQARGERALDCGTDIYSLGITFYQLVTGGLPFEGASHADLLIKHATDPRVPPHERNPKVSRAVSDLILRMIDPDRQKRPATPGQVVEEIRTILAAPNETRPPSAAEPERRIAARVRDPFRAAPIQAGVPWGIGVQYRDKYAVVSLSGHLDDSFDREITRKLARIVERGIAGIVVDLSALAYMNSRGVSAFVAIMDEVREKGGDVKLAGAKPQAMLVLERLGITLIIQHLPSVDKALAAFHSSPTPQTPASADSEPLVDLPTEGIPSSSVPMTPETAAAGPPIPLPAKEEEHPQQPPISPLLTGRSPMPATSVSPGASSANRKLIVALISLAALFALTCTALVALLIRAHRTKASGDGESTAAKPGPVPLPREDPPQIELVRQMESLRKFAATSQDLRAVLDRCKELRPSVLWTEHREELDAIAVRVEALLGPQRDRFLLEIREMIMADRDFRRRNEVISMLDAAINLSYTSRDPRFSEIHKQYEEQLEKAMHESLVKARKAKTEGASISEQLTLYAETARLAEKGPSYVEATVELDSLKARARELIPDELVRLKSQLAPLVPDNYPAAYHLAKASESRYPLAEWKEPVAKELQTLWVGCALSFSRLLLQAENASQQGDFVTVRRLRERLVKWQIPEFLPQFDKAIPGVRFAFLGIEADLNRVTSAGLALARVIPGAAAERGGIKDGDIILELDGRKISTFDDLRAFIIEKSPGDRVKVKIERESKQLEFECELNSASPRSSWTPKSTRHTMRGASGPATPPSSPGVVPHGGRSLGGSTESRGSGTRPV